MMQQRYDQRRPSAAIYRPPIRRQGKFRDFPRGGHNNASGSVNTDGDIDMSGEQKTERRFNPYGQRNNSNFKRKFTRKPRGSGNHSEPSQSQRGFQPTNGFKITVINGKRVGMPFIYQTILNSIKGTFIPLNFNFVEEDAVFFVNDHSTARQIREMNRKITTPDGFQMSILQHRFRLPPPNFDANTLELIKNITSGRFDSMSHCLDLSYFHNDQNMKSLGLCLPLMNSFVFSTISNIIKEHIPQLETLDLTGNKLSLLTALSSITPVCKQIKCLNLKNNRLRSISDLNPLKGLNLTDLILDGNPLCGDYKDKTAYIGAVRNLFPKLINLDGMLLPAPIEFDLGTETLPQSKKSCFAADNVKDMVLKFLDQYYSIYDSGDRSKLLDAYHDNAYFSLCLSKSIARNSRGTLGSYSMDSRNLLVVEHPAERFKLLREGKLPIVALLSQLPQTMHDPSSFSIDIFHISPTLMSFSVIGVFKEVGADINNATEKTFSRTFVVAAHGSGFVITNETMFIAHASQDQQSKAFKVPAPTPSPSPAPPNEEKSPIEKQMMVAELVKQSGMNPEFSAKCLEENDFDYQRAVAVFLKFKSEGKLPAEAFIKQEPDTFIKQEPEFMS
ncbi:hypothetical protein JTE90_002696 [Oedothorax gibbosus]|uniref:Nuclear RNA export factor 1 n=1 Tax=Oedothorax gibbosus TaxID=931172 RepID=A0AAV6VZ70_9ARAC|nr:hypothetical protein JTE90_002696 [Oedothorax gibbosus]